MSKKTFEPPPFWLAEFPVKDREKRELLIAEDFCPQCGGELDTGWECNKCGFDAKPEADDIDVDGHHRGNR